MRKPRNSNVPELSLLAPFDVTKFGGEEDPCFGKLYDLTTEECQACGDHELCAISFVRTLKAKREENEKQIPAKDLDIDNLELVKEIRDFVSNKISKGYKEHRAHSMAARRYHYHINKIKQIVNG